MKGEVSGNRQQVNKEEAGAARKPPLLTNKGLNQPAMVEKGNIYCQRGQFLKTHQSVVVACGVLVKERLPTFVTGLNLALI